MKSAWKIWKAQHDIKLEEEQERQKRLEEVADEYAKK